MDATEALPRAWYDCLRWSESSACGKWGTAQLLSSMATRQNAAQSRLLIPSLASERTRYSQAYTSLQMEAFDEGRIVGTGGGVMRQPRE